MSGLIPDGRDGLRAVNLARWLQGLGVVWTPPRVLTVPYNDRVEISSGGGAPPPVPPLAVHVFVAWTRAAPPGGSAHVLMVWSRPRVTVPAGGCASRRYGWCGCVSIEVGVPVEIDPLLVRPGNLVPGGVISLRLGIAEVGLAPFVLREGWLGNQPL